MYFLVNSIETVGNSQKGVDHKAHLGILLIIPQRVRIKVDLLRRAVRVGGGGFAPSAAGLKFANERQSPNAVLHFQTEDGLFVHTKRAIVDQYRDTLQMLVDFAIEKGDHVLVGEAGLVVSAYPFVGFECGGGGCCRTASHLQEIVLIQLVLVLGYRFTVTQLDRLLAATLIVEHELLHLVLLVRGSDLLAVVLVVLDVQIVNGVVSAAGGRARAVVVEANACVDLVEVLAAQTAVSYQILDHLLQIGLVVEIDQTRAKVLFLARVLGVVPVKALGGEPVAVGTNLNEISRTLSLIFHEIHVELEQMNREFLICFTFARSWVFEACGFFDVTLEHFLPVLVEPLVAEVVRRVEIGEVLVEFGDLGRVGLYGEGAHRLFVVVLGHVDSV